MKLSRKLLPALAMLLVSAVMMSTASFAWFSTNTTAYANGMSVQIATAQNLLISENDADDYKSMYGASINKTNMSPASAENVPAPKFYYVTTAGKIQPDSSAAASDTVFAEDTTEKHYAKFSVDLKAVGEVNEGKVSNIQAQIRLNDTYESAIHKTLRVLIVVNGTDSFIYAPAGGTANYAPITGTSSTDVGDTITSFSNDTTNLIKAEGGLVFEQKYDVDVYIWFEGQDEDCKATNAVAIEAMGLTIDFKLVEADAA